jgi:CRISPR/Cas system-associated endonuclease/helicase Cas3
MDRASVELYLNSDRDTGAANKKLFDQFHAQAADVEKAFGEPLEWMRLDSKKACRIVKTVAGEGLKAQAEWPEIQDAMIDAMVRLERTFRPRIQKLKTGS